LRHVHLKDYAVHPTPSGYRLVRCALGSGVVDWPSLLPLIERQAPQVEACIELGAATARHIRLYEGDYWGTYAPRPLAGVIEALRDLHRAARPAGEEWRTPHERGAAPGARAAYELQQLDASVAYLRRLGRL
ncbi:MAG: sugar phosphate isomerase/epimerase, partial [Gemmatimonadota bacterium]